LAVDAGTTGGTVALIVGLSAAAATVVGALINARQQRRDVRDNLARDVELAKQLEDGSKAKSILEEFITRQIRFLAVRAYTQVERIVLTAMFVIAQASTITALGIAVASHEQLLRRVVITLAIASTALFWISSRVLRRAQKREYAKRRLASDQTPTDSSIRTKLRNAKKLKRIRAAWKVLTGPDEPL
jgi:hypothetical protein